MIPASAALVRAFWHVRVEALIRGTDHMARKEATEIQGSGILFFITTCSCKNNSRDQHQSFPRAIPTMA